MLYDSAVTTEEKDKVLPKYLDACLRMPKTDLVSKLVMEYLTKNNVTADNPVMQTIDKFFKDTNIADKNTILKSLQGIKFTPTKAGWDAKIQQWSELINKTESLNTIVPKETG